MPPEPTASSDAIEMPPIDAPSEVPRPPYKPSDPAPARIGFALVGLGRLTLEELLPALRMTRHCRLAAVVSGDRDKATKVARHHGLPDSAVYDYENFDRIADDPGVQVVFIVLPNSQHLEFTVRAARAGKHVLCEKPMANSVVECRQMIDACAAADRLLMLAYRSQFEPRGQAVRQMVSEGRLGRLREFVSSNSQAMGDPAHWRLDRALAGGGPLPDIGIYCINGARYLSGEEPSQVWGEIDSDAADPRFGAVETSVRFVMRFPSGFRATCHSSYAAHKSQFLRLMGSDAWVEMDPAYAYRGIRMRVSRVVDRMETVTEPTIAEVNQFAAEMDHMAECVRSGAQPRTGGEEGLRDLRIIESIYASAASGRWVDVPSV